MLEKDIKFSDIKLIVIKVIFKFCNLDGILLYFIFLWILVRIIIVKV